MKKLVVTLAVAATLAGLAVAAAQPARLDQLDTVIISGTRSTPLLWKVSKGKHVLWVLAGYGPLPAGAAWQKVEARVAESQELLYQADSYAYIDIGLLATLKLAKDMYKAGPLPFKEPDTKNLPDNKTLKDVLPTDTYEKWLELRRKYIGENDDTDKYRPAAAVQALEDAAYNTVYLAAFPRSGLRRVGSYDAIDLARKHKVRIHELPEIERKVNAGNPGDLLTSASNLALPDVECFTTVVGSLESRLQWRKAELDAWARGDLEKLRSLHGVSSWRRYGGSCADVEEASSFALAFGAMLHKSVDSAKVKQLADELRRNREQAVVQAQKKWIAGVRSAIRNNKSTFAIVSLHQILGPEGFIEKLRALGYTVEDPVQGMEVDI